MRVIAGEYKGRRLEAPAAGENLRPTTDKVKEAVFSMLSNDTYGRVFADVFAGTGGIGIEALSRGASHCYFGDVSRESIGHIRNNLQACGIADEATVVTGSYERLIDRINGQADVFYLDPPYAQDYLIPCIMRITDEGKLAAEGLILCEHDKREDMPDEVCGLTKVKEKKYGRVKVTVYTKPIK